jgi:hypothetical protein
MASYKRALENSRTGIDPGILCIFTRQGAPREALITGNKDKNIKNPSGGYLKPLSFKDEYLSKTGLIILPQRSEASAMAHEYGHFEDEIFYKGERSHTASKMRELVAHLSELEMFRDLYTKDLPAVPESLADFEDKFLDAVAKAVPHMNMDKWGGRPRPREEIARINENMVRALKTSKYLHENGLSWTAIKSLAMHAKTFKDFLQWRSVPKKELTDLAKKSG